MRKILVYDYEVFKHDTLLGVLNEETKEIIQLWDIPKIKEMIVSELHNIWIGFNSDHYDKVLSHGILSGKLTTPEQVFNCSTAVIDAQDRDTPLFGILNKFGISDYYNSPILSYDCMGDGSFMSLKQNEGFMGMDIVESIVPFNLDRPLTDEEKRNVERYNRADLYGTLERFKQRKNTFKTKMLLVKEFDLPISYMCKTNAKLTEAILLSQNKGTNTRLRRDFQLCDLPVNWKVPELKKIYDFFVKALIELETHKWNTRDCDSELLSMDLDILGVVHTFALGGVHGGLKNYILNPHPSVRQKVPY